MLLEVLPSSLYESSNIEVILKNDNSSIIFKSLSKSLENKKMYISSVAVLLVMEGEQNIQNYDGADLIVKENEMVVLPKDLYVVSDFVTKDNAFKAYVFFIDDLIIKKYLLLNQHELVKTKNKNQVLKTKISHQISHYIESLNEVYKKQKSNKSLIEIKIIEFLLLLELQENSKAFISSLVSPIQKRSIKKFMEENYLTNLNISDYALLTGRSVSTFNREFKRLYSTTPKKWLIAKRLKKSHELLKNTNLNVTEVSMAVGYENVSHFIDAYKKIYEITPKSTLNKKLNKI